MGGMAGEVDLAIREEMGVWLEGFVKDGEDRMRGRYDDKMI